MSGSKSARISRMTAREKDAGGSGGWLDERIPENEIRKLIDNQPFSIDSEKIVESVARAAGWYRFERSALSLDLKPQEVRDQARSTAEVADELLIRLRNMHPAVKARTDAYLLELNQDLVLTIIEQLGPDLLRLMAALEKTASDFESVQVRRGRKQYEERDRALCAVFLAIREVAPDAKLDDARGLAAELLKLAEPHMPIPEDVGELRKIMRGN